VQPDGKILRQYYDRNEYFSCSIDEIVHQNNIGVCHYGLTVQALIVKNATRTLSGFRERKKFANRGLTWTISAIFL
jgi:hypothetical protein